MYIHTYIYIYIYRERERGACDAVGAARRSTSARPRGCPPRGARDAITSK